MDDPIAFIVSNAKYYFFNFIHNVTNLWYGMTLIKYIRLIAILGGYILLRPYLEKLGAKIQAKEYEKQAKAAQASSGGTTAKISPNALRGAEAKETVIDDEEESEAEGAASAVQWGKKAKKRQKQLAKKILEEGERKRLEAEGDLDDKDIMDLLVDYEEGQDGW